MGSEYARPAADNGRVFGSPDTQDRNKRVKPQMQTSVPQAFGGPPQAVDSADQGAQVQPIMDPGLLKFDEIVLESNEVDLAELQQAAGFTERRFPQAIYLGIMIDGKRNGKGVMKYANGRQYEG